MGDRESKKGIGPEEEPQQDPEQSSPLKSFRDPAVARYEAVMSGDYSVSGESAVTEPQMEAAVEKELEKIAEFTFPSSVQAKFGELMERNNEGGLTAEEREELRGLVELNELVSILKGQARLLLRFAPAMK